MKILALFPLFIAPSVWAVPASELQAILNNLDEISDVTNAATANLFGGIAKGIGYAVDYAQEVLHDGLHLGKETLDKWADEGREFVKQDGLVYELVTHSAFQDYQLRVTDPDLCDPTVKQHSGYLDITDGKHLFFWFFESRTAPEDAPLTLWLNGGPGCSSIAGLLFENGPCRVTDEGKSTTPFEHSWNKNSNIIFLDQPVDVGYSYSTDGTTVNTSPVAAEDVYAFIELFLARYPEYADKPFHVAAESYGGIYAPNIGSVIHKKNKELTLRPTPGVKHVNLASIILANGQTDPRIQLASVPDYVCDGPYPLFDDPEGAQCTALRSKVPTCQRLIQGCYNYNSRLTCVPAIAYCYSQLMGPVQQTGVNPYDVRKKCDRSKDGSLCYKEMEWVETWMNLAANKKALGVPAERKFQTCNMEVNQAFFGQG
ncbi:hypothetical protein QCA50_002327 [Cerrena zonata]|uniref:Carboxypeptidase n=1 Tax=Cerrena zonata TaxID=2478898 RepID=A0AAW0GR82_9APHY